MTRLEIVILVKDGVHAVRKNSGNNGKLNIQKS